MFLGAGSRRVSRSDAGGESFQVHVTAQGKKTKSTFFLNEQWISMSSGHVFVAYFFAGS